MAGFGNPNHTALYNSPNLKQDDCSSSARRSDKADMTIQAFNVLIIGAGNVNFGESSQPGLQLPTNHEQAALRDHGVT